MVSHGMAWLSQQGLHRYYFTSILFGLWISCILCSEPAAAQANSTVNAEVIQVKVGETVTLSCEIPDTGEFRVFWKKGTQIISMGTTVFSGGPRLNLDNGYGLQIKDVVLTDEASYECQVSTTPMIQHFKKVIVTVPPQVEMSMTAGPHSLMLGEVFELICTATGKPKPTLTWKKSGKKFPIDQMPESTLQIQSLSYEDGGQYECTADNGIGDPASGSVSIEVHYEPKATIADDFIHTGPGRLLSVSCSVESSPDAQVTWTFDGMPIEESGRISRTLTVQFPKTIHGLSINPVTVDDLGQYECIARNVYGEEADSFNLTANPQKASITSKDISSYSQAYRIRWKVKSIPQLVSSKIKLRLLNDTEAGPWQEMNVPVNPGDKRGDKPDRYSLTFDITGLAPESVYEVMVRAENDFGFGDFSDPFTFQTPMSGNDTLPAPPPTTRKPVIAEERNGQEDETTTLSGDIVSNITTASPTSTKTYVPYVMEENGSGRLEHHRFSFFLSLMLCSVIWSIL